MEPLTIGQAIAIYILLTPLVFYFGYKHAKDEIARIQELELKQKRLEELETSLRLNYYKKMSDLEDSYEPEGKESRLLNEIMVLKDFIIDLKSSLRYEKDSYNQLHEDYRNLRESIPNNMSSQG